MKTLISEILKEVIAKYSDDIINNCSFENLSSCRCVLDKNALKIVIINLIDNAIKYNEGEFSLKIQSQCLSKYCRIEFADNGVGIPAKERKRIFRKFYRVYGHDIPNVKGTGLGLYVSREIVKMHGGKIKAISPGKNLGTTIRIDLPIYKKIKKRYMNRLLRHTIKRKKRSEQTES